MAIHVLQFFSVLGNGGAENRMMDVFRCIHSDVIQFDFAVVHDWKGFFDDEVLANHSKLYRLPDPGKGLLRNYLALISFFREHTEFQAVHAHVAWYSGVVLMAAKQAGIPVRIAHARDSAKPNRTAREKCINLIGKLLIQWSATQKLAISSEAAENIFGKRVVRNQDYVFVPNSIDQKKYVFLSGEVRAARRKALGIPSGKKAYVTVGNLRPQKNHLFLIDIAKKLADCGDQFVWYLIGEGPCRKEIEEKVHSLNLQSHVVLWGNRSDVPEILGVFDCMIFPSLFEGLGGVVLEAQLVGVPSVVSDAIPSVADVGIGMVEYLSLQDPLDLWADAVIQKSGDAPRGRKEILEAFGTKGYSIEETTRKYLHAYSLDDETIERAIRRE